MNVTPLAADEVGLGAVGWRGETPLWVLHPSRSGRDHRSACLGPVGGRIVAEVVITPLERDPESILSRGGAFQPLGPLIDHLQPDARGS